VILLSVILAIALAGALTCSFLIRQAYLRARYGGGLVPASLVAHPLRMVVTLVLLAVGLTLSVYYFVIALGILAMGAA
jgi:hypothetical protein|tara:strand:- start:3757 stop:3990 length:234 start_codon:yes stop_codon:yes gene_type:complete